MIIEEFIPVSFTVSEWARFHVKLFAVVFSYAQFLGMMVLLVCALHLGWSLI